MRALLSVLAFGAAGRCASLQFPPPNQTAAATVTLNEVATGGAVDPALRQLLHDHWEAMMAAFPVWATELGDHRYDDRLDDESPRTRADQREQWRRFMGRAAALRGRALSAADQTTLELLIASLQADEETAVCHLPEWNISPRYNVLGTINYLAELHPLHAPGDATSLLARYRQIQTMVGNAVSNLRLGVDSGLTPNAASVRLTVDMVDEALGVELEKWPMLQMPAEKASSALGQEEAGAFKLVLTSLVAVEVQPALAAYRDFLRDELLPVARDVEHEGLWALPGGKACYSALVRKFTTLPKTSDELHSTGLSELARIRAYTADLGEKEFGTRDLQAIFERLRTDPDLYFKTAEEVQAKAEAAVAAARAEIPNWFGTLPKAPCVVKPVPDFEAPYTTIAYYRGPSSDGERPGTYYVNLYAPETRPRHEAEALAFHEAIPGHHLQIAIAEELERMPAFRRHMGMTAYVEGWALYTEQLASEMGMYSGNVDRLGMASFELWRAARLVVDTGLHAKGWTRERAVQFMLENTPLAENNIRNEVDRYITDPGQALSYKTGQLEIWRLRRAAEEELGPGFDIRSFHDAVLAGGAVSLPVLGAQVRSWTKSRAR